MKDIKDYLHLYFDCFVQVTTKSAQFQGLLKGVYHDRWSSSSFSHELSIQVLTAQGGPHTYKLEQVKLILRPLSDMTEEEAISVYTLERDGHIYSNTTEFDVRMSDKAWRVIRLDDLKHTLFIGWSARIWKVIEDQDTLILDVLNHQPSMYAFLLSKGFDLFGLIEAGLAIDKTKL